MTQSGTTTFVENEWMYIVAVNGTFLVSKITMSFTFILVFVVQLNLNFQVAFLSQEAGFKSTKNKGVVMETQTKRCFA